LGACAVKTDAHGRRRCPQQRSDVIAREIVDVIHQDNISLTGRKLVESVHHNTEHLTLVHIIRKVLLRVSSYLDYVIIKHSISLGH